MEPYWSADGCELYTGDVLEVLPKLPERSVQCAVTSPPYWGLRDYGEEGQIGLEETPEEYIERMVEVFRAVRRVLRDDGTVWVNVGDGYAGHWGGDYAHTPWGQDRSPDETTVPNKETPDFKQHAFKPKDLLGIPWKLAFALRADGWYLRSAIVWAKGVSFCDSYSGSVMPESVNGWRWERCKTRTWPDADTDSNEELRRDRQNGRDCGEPEVEPCPGCEKCCDGHGPDGYVLRRGSWRPTSAHEYVFMLAKSARYFCDAEAVREPSGDPEGTAKRYESSFGGEKNEALNDSGLRQTKPEGERTWDGGRNPRDVWTIGTSGTSRAHYAAYPEALMKPILQAATPKHACGVCGAPWAPVVTEGGPDMDHRKKCGSDRSGGYHGEGKVGPTRGQSARDVKKNILRGMNTRRVERHHPTCEHDQKARPVVLDPFSGTATTGVAAIKQDCRYMGVDLSEKYQEMARNRLREVITGVPEGEPEQCALWR